MAQKNHRAPATLHSACLRTRLGLVTRPLVRDTLLGGLFGCSASHGNVTIRHLGSLEVASRPTQALRSRREPRRRGESGEGRGRTSSPSRASLASSTLLRGTGDGIYA